MESDDSANDQDPFPAVNPCNGGKKNGNTLQIPSDFYEESMVIDEAT